VSVHFDSSCALVRVREPPNIPAHPRQGKEKSTWSTLIRQSRVAAGKDEKTSQDLPSDLTDFHGAPPLEATLAREVNGKMMGKLLFGNIGWGRKVQCSMFYVSTGLEP
jgi:hypothetical protein